jgi:hypothetical protein
MHRFRLIYDLVVIKMCHESVAPPSKISDKRIAFAAKFFVGKKLFQIKYAWILGKVIHSGVCCVALSEFALGE